MHLKYRPNYAKIVEMMLHLAHLRPGLDKYQVVKLFYLADREHLNRFGRPISQDTYYALKYGPVASVAMDLMRADSFLMNRAGVETLPFDLGTSSEGHACLGQPHREVDYDLFSKTDLAVIEEIVEKYGNLSFDDLFEETHEHDAYKFAWGRRGNQQRAEMYYEEMIESKDKRQALVEDVADVSMRL